MLNKWRLFLLLLHFPGNLVWPKPPWLLQCILTRGFAVLPQPTLPPGERELTTPSGEGPTVSAAGQGSSCPGSEKDLGGRAPQLAHGKSSPAIEIPGALWNGSC